MKIYITGDTHCPIDIKRLNAKNFPEQKSLTKDDVLIICGDFGGVWDNSKEEKFWLDWLNKKTFTTLFVDGNHENFELLNALPVEEKFGGKVHRVNNSVYHLMRGEIYDLGGKSFFVLGGARSHDRVMRREGKNWWQEEMPSYEERMNALGNLDMNDWTVDYILTHCAPSSIQRKINDYYETDKMTDFLDVWIKEKVNYQHWYFGHYHDDYQVDDKHTCLYYDIVEVKEMDGLNVKKLLENKEVKIISTEEALKDVEPFFTDEEIEALDKPIIGVSYGTMGVIPAHLSEQFLECFKGPGVDREKLKEMANKHKGKREHKFTIER